MRTNPKIQVLVFEIDEQDERKIYLAALSAKITDLEAIIKLGNAEFGELKWFQVSKKFRNRHKVAWFSKNLATLKAIYKDLLQEISHQAPSETQTFNVQAHEGN